MADYVKPFDATDPNASFVNGNPSAGVAGSIPDALMWEVWQRELKYLIVASGQTASNADLTQVKQAVDRRALAVVGPLTPAAASSSFVFTPGAAFSDFTGGATTSFSGPFTTVASLTVPAGASYLVISAVAAFRVAATGGEDCRTRIRYTTQGDAAITSTKYQGVRPAGGNQIPSPISLVLQNLDKTKSTVIELLVDSSKTTPVQVYDPRIDVQYG